MLLMCRFDVTSPLILEALKNEEYYIAHQSVNLCVYMLIDLMRESVGDVT